MREFFKKGHNVPNKLVDIPKKIKHLLVFNCDCVLDGNVIMPLKLTDSVFLLKGNGGKKPSHIKFNGIVIS
ncbi:hypothetical protein P4a_00028 [Klebsiella phage VLCpiP4a]|nr:hypothetical protein P4a_00028 [Klebsiella phage VLCpiP4a]